MRNSSSQAMLGMPASNVTINIQTNYNYGQNTTSNNSNNEIQGYALPSINKTYSSMQKLNQNQSQTQSGSYFNSYQSTKSQVLDKARINKDVEVMGGSMSYLPKTKQTQKPKPNTLRKFIINSNKGSLKNTQGHL